MFEINIVNDQVTPLLDRLQGKLEDMTPVMQAISQVFVDQTEENYAQQGRPAWLPLSEETIKKRTKDGTWPGRIMQISGQLAASMTPYFGKDFAGIGSNVVQAAIQNLGGMAGRGRKVEIPARPQVPITTDRQLQPEAVKEILQLMNEFFVQT